jgi:hypothetical protein
MAKKFAWHLLSSSGGITSYVKWSRNCISCVPRCLIDVYQLRLELSTPSMTSCVPRSARNCISCVPRCLLHVYKLRLELSTTSTTSCIPRLVRNCISCVPRCYFMRICCVPSRQPHACELYRKMCVYKLSNNLTVLTHFYCMYVNLYTIICTHTELLNEIGNV